MKKRLIGDRKIREQVRDFIEDALATSIKAYREYMDGTTQGDARKKYEENQKVGKVALSHIEMLMELACVADLPSEDGYGMELSTLLQQASAEIDRYRDNGGEDE